MNQVNCLLGLMYSPTGRGASLGEICLTKSSSSQRLTTRQGSQEYGHDYDDMGAYPMAEGRLH